MKDLYAVCAVAPPGRRIEQHSFTLRSSVDMDPAILSSRGMALEELCNRFPMAAVFVGRPKRSVTEALIGVRAMLDGDVGAEIDWPLVRIRDIEQPVVLVPDESKVYRAVNCRVVTRSGNPVPLRLRWQQASENGRVAPKFGRTGEDLLLAPGSYRIYPEVAAPWLKDAFGDPALTIHPDDPPRIEKMIVLEKSFRLLIVRPQVPPGEFRGVIHVDIQAADSGYGVMNWEPARGPIECLLPPGRARISVQGPMYSADPVDLDVTERDEPLEIDLPLRHRAELEGEGPVRGPSGK